MDADGHNPRQVTNDNGDGTITYAEWAAGDENLIVTVAGGGEAWLTTVPVTGGDLMPFAPAPASHPAVTADGEMVFVTVGGPNLDLILVDSAGNVLDVVADSTEWEDMPSISPDGLRVAYQIGQKGERRIAITSLEDGAVNELPRIGSDDSNPVWSPDGSALALVANRDGSDTVWIVSDDGRERRPLDLGVADLGEPEAIWYLSWTA
jgi:Tol biopolymer transport system component